MSAKAMKPLLALGLVLAVLTIFPACGGKTDPNAQAPAWQPRKVAVLPFMWVPADPGQGTASSPLTGSTFMAGQVKPSAKSLASLDASLMEELRAIGVPFEVVPPSQAGQVFQRMDRADMGAPLVRKAADTGLKVGADGVLVGLVYRMRQRVGTELGVDSPASVAFDIALIRCGDANLVWKNSFDRAQKSLTADVLSAGKYFKHGLKWMTAEEYSRWGIEQLMLRFPWRTKPADGE